MAEQDDSIFGGLFSEPAENIQPETVGALDYLTDIPVGAIKGVSQALQELKQHYKDSLNLMVLLL